jgi:small subunit ribosomal protein S8
MLTRIRNGQSAGKTEVSTSWSRLLSSVVDVLKREGYIRDYKQLNESAFAKLSIELKYHDSKPVIQEIGRVSKPGRRVYSKIADLPKVRNGLGIYILSTPLGVMSDQEARLAHVGGEVLCKVF